MDDPEWRAEWEMNMIRKYGKAPEPAPPVPPPGKQGELGKAAEKMFSDETSAFGAFDKMGGLPSREAVDGRNMQTGQENKPSHGEEGISSHPSGGYSYSGISPGTPSVTVADNSSSEVPDKPSTCDH